MEVQNPTPRCTYYEKYSTEKDVYKLGKCVLLFIALVIVTVDSSMFERVQGIEIRSSYGEIDNYRRNLTGRD